MAQHFKSGFIISHHYQVHNRIHEGESKGEKNRNTTLSAPWHMLYKMMVSNIKYTAKLINKQL
jgi:hypothetical protein